MSRVDQRFSAIKYANGRWQTAKGLGLGAAGPIPANGTSTANHSSAMMIRFRARDVKHCAFQVLRRGLSGLLPTQTAIA